MYHLCGLFHTQRLLTARIIQTRITTSINVTNTKPSNATNTSATGELPVEALDYHLPPELIAQRPAEPRDSARLLVLRRSNDSIDHRQVRDLPDLLDAGDVMVFNNTFVLPARFEGIRADTAGHIEGLFLHTLPSDGDHWLVMLRSNGRLHENITIELLDCDQNRRGITMRLIERVGEQWAVDVQPDNNPQRILAAIGRTPIPPYIRWARIHGEHPPDEIPIPDHTDRAWYQTIYADAQHAGSIAAPTAGLHFTPELLNQLKSKNVGRVDVTLHVGAGTFKPVNAPTIQQHKMHSESFAVSTDALQSLREAASANRRIIAVGTTAARTLESLPHPLPAPSAGPITSDTELLIAPGYDFKLLQGLLTNFHLPRSTLLALVAAIIGLERMHDIYRIAIDRGYRFYSYGDAMLILP